jgi:photosystem II stability/assembly factor-like uncharacterized protein
VVAAASCTGTSSAHRAAPTQTVTPAPIETTRYPASSSPSPQTHPSAAGFRATDVTFVSDMQGWAIGADGIEHTSDGGHAWQRLPMPISGARNVRFATVSTGYLWRLNHRLMLTTDAGATWRLGGLDHVVDVEISGVNAWAIVGPEPGGYVWHAPVGSTSWTQLGIIPNRSATLDVQGSLAYVTGQQGAGPVAPSLDVWSADGTVRHEALPCVRNRRLVAWSPLGVSTNGSLVMDCDVEEPRPVRQLLYVSSDEGRTWTQVAAPPVVPDDVTAIPGTRFAFGHGIYVDHGSGWKQVLPADAGRQFVVAGFEDDTHGVALTRHGSLYRTVDGGQSWDLVRF